MRLTIKRRDILDALRYNHLVAGSWFEVDRDGDSADIYKPGCTACLVGSAVRRAAKREKVFLYAGRTAGSILANLISETTGDQIVDEVVDQDILAELVQARDYLTALSYIFEGTLRAKAIRRFGPDYLTDQLKRLKLTKVENERIRKWVLENIPVEFTVAD